MSLTAHLLPWGVDFSTSWIALLVINNVTSPMHDDGWNSPNQKQKYCAGAFVGGSWFLTSASCLQPLPEPHQVTVMTGWGNFKCSQNQLWEFQSIGLEIDLHPGYSDSSFVDLAMVRTRRTVFHVPEAELNRFPHILSDSGCRLLSFEENHPQDEDKIIQAGFVSVNRTDCPREDQKRKICTEYKDRDGWDLQILPEKLGALLECDGELTGVLTQSQTKSTVSKKLQIFENIREHRNWILDTIENAYDILHDDGPPRGWQEMDDETFINLLKEDELWRASQREYNDYEIDQTSSVDKHDSDKRMSGLYNFENMKFSRPTNFYLNVATIFLCIFCLVAVIYLCIVQFNRFDNISV